MFSRCACLSRACSIQVELFRRLFNPRSHESVKWLRPLAAMSFLSSTPRCNPHACQRTQACQKPSGFGLIERDALTPALSRRERENYGMSGSVKKPRSPPAHVSKGGNGRPRLPRARTQVCQTAFPSQAEVRRYRMRSGGRNALATEGQPLLVRLQTSKTGRGRPGYTFRERRFGRATPSALWPRRHGLGLG